VYIGVSVRGAVTGGVVGRGEGRVGRGEGRVGRGEGRVGRGEGRVGGECGGAEGGVGSVVEIGGVRKKRYLTNKIIRTNATMKMIILNLSDIFLIQKKNYG
jgi:hypothetical protein